MEGGGCGRGCVEGGCVRVSVEGGVWKGVWKGVCGRVCVEGGGGGVTIQKSQFVLLVTPLTRINNGIDQSHTLDKYHGRVTITTTSLLMTPSPANVHLTLFLLEFS